MSTTQNDIYETVTNRIIEAIEGGVGDWIKPWATSGLPSNAKTGKAYRGVNTLLLWMQTDEMGYGSNQWLTFKQAKELGGSVLRGQRGTQIVFFKFNEKQKEVKGVAQFDENGDPIMAGFPVAKAYTVFNIEQTDLVEQTDDVEIGENVAQDFIDGIDHDVTHKGSRAFYSIKQDLIALPPSKNFDSMAHYYNTYLHELTHWTGSESRLDRKFGKRFGDNAYAAEELVAEIGAAFACAALGIEGGLRHAEYVNSWLEVLKADKRAIFTAASKAQQAFDFLSTASE